MGWCVSTTVVLLPAGIGLVLSGQLLGMLSSIQDSALKASMALLGEQRQAGRGDPDGRA